MTWHYALNWPWVAKAYRDFRKLAFTKPRPEGAYLRVGQSPEEIEALLGSQGFAPNWEFSYNKRGEVLNLAYVYHATWSGNGAVHEDWMQVHVRGWENDDGGTDLIAHWEYEPTENPVPHLKGEAFNQERGMRRLVYTLHELDVEYERVQWSSDGRTRCSECRPDGERLVLSGATVFKGYHEPRRCVECGEVIV